MYPCELKIRLYDPQQSMWEVVFAETLSLQHILCNLINYCRVEMKYIKAESWSSRHFIEFAVANILTVFWLILYNHLYFEFSIVLI